MKPSPLRRLRAFQPGKPVGNVYYGACSWTDRTLIEGGTFYPGNARTAAGSAGSHYASQFPIVEVDATYYALPSERNAHLWVDERRPASSSTSRRSACSRITLWSSSGCRLR